METPWKPFWFESNVVWGLMDTREKWNETKAEWYKYNEASDDIYSLRASGYGKTIIGTNDDVPNFGCRKEHFGNYTLSQFFADNNMEKI